MIVYYRTERSPDVAKIDPAVCCRAMLVSVDGGDEAGMPACAFGEDHGSAARALAERIKADGYSGKLKRA